MISLSRINLPETSEARRSFLIARGLLRAIGSVICLCFGLATLMSAQSLDDAPSNVLRQPDWNYGVQISGGTTIVQVSAPRFETANRSISNIAVLLHAGRVLTREHGPGWTRGTFEWDFNVIPAENFWILGSHYAGGFEALGPRWNFTNRHRTMVPFVGISGGMLFSPNNFPPGDTARFNFTAAVDAGTHLFLRSRQSLDVGVRFQHLSNAYLGDLKPGVPLSLQVMVGYSWY